MFELVLFLNGYSGFLEGVFAKVSFGWEWVGVPWVHFLVFRPKLSFACEGVLDCFPLHGVTR